MRMIALNPEYMLRDMLLGRILAADRSGREIKGGTGRGRNANIEQAGSAGRRYSTKA